MSRILPPSTAFSVRTKKVRVKPKLRSIKDVDAIFSRCVREGANWTCARCGKSAPRGAQNMQASHLWGRALRSGRWAPLNVCCHCGGCHMLLGQNPALFHEWIKDYQGARYDDWYALRLVSLKVRPADREAMYQHFVKVHAEMLRLRDMGITERIPFEGWR